MPWFFEMNETCIENKSLERYTCQTKIKLVRYAPGRNGRCDRDDEIPKDITLTLAHPHAWNLVPKESFEEVIVHKILKN